MTSPAKTVAKTFQRMGAASMNTSKHGTEFRFPDGAQKLVPGNMSPATARSMLKWATDRYGYEDRPAVSGERTHRAKPKLNLERVTASNHAKERLALMRRQDGLEMREILLALRAPQRTLWSVPHQSWLWVGERVTVAAHVQDDGSAVISTLLWSTRELWDANPRPQARTA